MAKKRGHHCWVCRRTLPNEKFSGRGHREHVCKQCATARRRERRAASTRGVVGGVRRASLDAATIQGEIDYLVSCAHARSDRLVTFGPLLFLATSSGDAWMFDPADGFAACLARDGVRESVVIAEKGEQVGIEWRCSYRIEGEAMVFVELATGRAETVLGYPCAELEAAAQYLRSSPRA